MIYESDDYVTDREKKIARVLAGAMHAAFVLLLVFGVAWQKRYSEPAAVVDLWSSLSPPRQEPLPAPPPAPKPLVKREPRPKPEPSRPTPKPEIKAQPKPDIALKEKLEKERRLKQQELEKKKQLELERRKQQDLERKKQQELERRKQDDRKAQQLDARKKEEEKRKLDQERVAREAEARRVAQESEMKAKLAREQANAQASAIDQYVRQIQNKVRRNIVEPPNLQGNPEVVFEVRVLPGGEILEDTLRLTRSSGNPAYDQAVERAIRKASPLPVPSDPVLFDRFRTQILRIRPRE